jgi:hypothetical protein
MQIGKLSAINPMKYALHRILTLLILIFLINCTSTSKLLSDDSLLKELDQTNYFKYCDQEEYKKLKSPNIKEPLNSNSIFDFYDDFTYQCYSKRNYHIDGEKLSDWGGIDHFITSVLHPFYEATGFKLDITEHIVKFDSINYFRFETLIVNNRKYEIFKNDYVRWGEAWYIAPIRIAEMINTELKLQNFEEQFYLINSENDLAGSFLTPSQYEFFKKNIKDLYWQPQSIESWKKLYNVKIKS